MLSHQQTLDCWEISSILCSGIVHWVFFEIVLHVYVRYFNWVFYEILLTAFVHFRGDPYEGVSSDKSLRRVYRFVSYSHNVMQIFVFNHTMSNTGVCLIHTMSCSNKCPSSPFCNNGHFFCWTDILCAFLYYQEGWTIWKRSWWPSSGKPKSQGPGVTAGSYKGVAHYPSSICHSSIVRDHCQK